MRSLKRFKLPSTNFSRLLPVLALALAVLAGCGGSGDADSLTLYSGRSESLVGQLVQNFEAATGIDVSVKYAGTPQLAATLLEEGNNTPADVFYAQDPGGLAAVAGMMAQLPDETLSQVPGWAVAPDGRWVGVSGRARTVVYNTERVTPGDLPDDISGFTAPEWRGRLGWAPANASFQTMVTAMRAVWGEEKTLEWLEGIHANEPKVFPKNTPIVAAAAVGEIDVGLVNHYYLHRFLKEQGESFGARNYHPPAGGPGAIIMVSGAGILSASDKKENGQKFIDYLLSTEAQQYFVEQTFEYPLLTGIPVAAGVTPLSEINNPDLTSEELSDLEGTQRLLRQAGVVP